MAFPETPSSVADLSALLVDGDHAGRFIVGLTSYFRERKPASMRLWRLSLTMPPWEPNHQRLLLAARGLARGLETEPGEGAWLALDVTKAGRVHVYGLALSCRPASWFVDGWIQLSGASAKCCTVVLVTGQDSQEGDEASPSWFAQNLARVVRYGLKSLPAKYDLPLAERVIAVGSLAPIWQSALTQLNARPSAPREQAPPLRLSAPTDPGRRCQRCKASLGAQKRKDAKWCSASCRTQAWAEKRAWKRQLTPAGLDAFEERAAILEAEAQLPKSEAESLAFAQVVRESGGQLLRLPN